MPDRLAQLTGRGKAGAPAPARPHRRARLALLSGAACLLALAAVQALDLYRVAGASMEGTLHCAGSSGCEALAGDRILVDKWAYRVRDPRRGEIVLLSAPAGRGGACEGEAPIVKRIVGLPGETVALVEGAVVVDGRRLEEPYVEPSRRGGASLAPRRLPVGTYFVLGDNRARSCDSRSFGPVPRASLTGLVRLVVWPLSRLQAP